MNKKMVIKIIFIVIGVVVLGIILSLASLVFTSSTSKSLSKRIARETEALDANVGSEASTLADEIDENKVKDLSSALR